MSTVKAWPVKTSCSKLTPHQSSNIKIVRGQFMDELGKVVVISRSLSFYTNVHR